MSVVFQFSFLALTPSQLIGVQNERQTKASKEELTSSFIAIKLQTTGYMTLTIVSIISFVWYLKYVIDERERL